MSYATTHEFPVEDRRGAAVRFGHLTESTMSPTRNPLSIVSAGALRAEQVRGLLIANADYYFFGYWFSHKRA